MSGSSLRPWSRLSSPRDYDAVFAKPKRQSDRYFTLLARVNAKPCGRLGLAVSKRVDKRAVGRNRIKRMIRESFRHHQEQLVGLDLVVVARPASGQAANDVLRRSLDQLLQRLTRREADRQPPSQRQ